MSLLREMPEPYSFASRIGRSPQSRQVLADDVHPYRGITHQSLLMMHALLLGRCVKRVVISPIESIPLSGEPICSDRFTLNLGFTGDD